MRNSWSPRLVALVVLSVFSLSDVAFGRIRWLERDGNPVFLHPRRFGQEHPAVIDKIHEACPGQVCGVLGGAAITPLIAAQGECTQQDMADRIINESKQFDAATQANMLALAKEYRQVEKNTPPDFTTNPPTNRNSVFCQKAPANSELNNLVQAQDPANDPNSFFDPAEPNKTVLKGSQPNTAPFQANANAAALSSKSKKDPVCQPPASGGTSSGTPTPTSSIPAKTSATPSATPSDTGSNQQQTSSSSTTSSDTPDFGKCSKPQVLFQTGLDGRKETAFGAVDQASYNHGSAQNIHVLTDFMRLALTNSCGANQAAKDLTEKAEAAADATTPAKSGAQADAFNKFFGFTTHFADVTPVASR